MKKPERIDEIIKVSKYTGTWQSENNERMLRLWAFVSNSRPSESLYFLVTEVVLFNLASIVHSCARKETFLPPRKYLLPKYLNISPLSLLK
jgi:hypothetical protein